MLGIGIQELFNGLYLRFINFGSYRCALGCLMFLFTEQKIGYELVFCTFVVHGFGGLVFLTLGIKIPVADAPVVIGSVNLGWLAMPQIFSYIFLFRFSTHKFSFLTSC